MAVELKARILARVPSAKNVARWQKARLKMSGRRKQPYWPEGLKIIGRDSRDMDAIKSVMIEQENEKMDRLERELVSVTAQRDGLLAALEKIERYYPALGRGDAWHDATIAVRAIARAAIDGVKNDPGK
ncbi:MAG: hypothetical protein C4542_02995 [Dehalococcoidia bacterium]|nr:MAG: hypothetical protein C4542_02995 [Dehalococcoidia bacterium]